MTKPCECQTRVCIRHRHIGAVIASGSFEGAVILLNDMEEELMHTETDLAYYKSIMQGTWPDSVRMLKAALEKAVAYEEKNKC